MKSYIQKLCLAIGLGMVVGTMACLEATAQSFTNLYSLQFTNGTAPCASLLLIGNTLYGTAEDYGGGNAGGSGSVFKLNLDGSSFTNMHTFTQGNDGGNPYDSLVLDGAMVYGTAIFGGLSNYGCIFGINTNGTGLTNLYSFPMVEFASFPFTNGNGAYPGSALVPSGGTLYGTAQGGGVYGWGVAFAVATNGGGYTNLHSFALSDGQYPGTLILAGGNLYGTAGGGGDNNYGSIFKLNTNGTMFNRMHSFPPEDSTTKTNIDGAFPDCALVLAGSTLYGTTSGGGTGANGTIFKIDTNGLDFAVIYNFSPTNGAGINADGAQPHAGLMLWSNVLYGTAEVGGAHGYGTVYSVNLDGSGFTTLYSFTATNAITGTNLDGAYPICVPVRSGSVIYGTASAGGTYTTGAQGNGTIWSLLAPPPLGIARVGTNAVVSWPTDVTGFNLESATNLVNADWSGVGGQYFVTNPLTRPETFYRLVHP